MEDLQKLASVMIMSGMLLVSVPKYAKYGMFVMLLGNIAWGVIGYSVELRFLMAQSVFLIVVNIIGMYNFNKKDRQKG